MQPMTAWQGRSTVLERRLILRISLLLVPYRPLAISSRFGQCQYLWGKRKLLAKLTAASATLDNVI